MYEFKGLSTNTGRRTRTSKSYCFRAKRKTGHSGGEWNSFKNETTEKFGRLGPGIGVGSTRHRQCLSKRQDWPFGTFGKWVRLFTFSELVTAVAYWHIYDFIIKLFSDTSSCSLYWAKMYYFKLRCEYIYVLHEFHSRQVKRGLQNSVRKRGHWVC